jgi:hypothetical protein
MSGDDHSESDTVARMLSVLRRYTRSPPRERDPDLMIESFKTAVEVHDNAPQPKRSITSDLAVDAFGIELVHERMENGEYRFRLFAPDGNGYILTIAPNGGWQKSHCHSEFRELYLVEHGWMALATPDQDRKPIIAIYQPGQTCVSPQGEVHNVYLSQRSTIHTVKYGIRGRYKRWEAHPWFNECTHPLSEQEILRLAIAHSAIQIRPPSDSN